MVVLAQTRDTDYLRRREIPVSGSAYLKVLIAYKTDRPADLIEVYEKGLHDNECYFPNPGVLEEGRRYLLFLRKDQGDKNRYLGLTEGCALEVLVDSNNRYAIRYPVTGIKLGDPLEDYTRAMEFHDPYAVVDDDELQPALRQSMLAAGQIEPFTRPQSAPGNRAAWMPLTEPAGRQWRYTTGIELGDVRRLMGAENLAH